MAELLDRIEDKVKECAKEYLYPTVLIMGKKNLAELERLSLTSLTLVSINKMKLRSRDIYMEVNSIYIFGHRMTIMVENVEDEIYVFGIIKKEERS